MPITEDSVKSNMLCVALSRTIFGKTEKDPRRSYNKCKEELAEQLKKEGDEIKKVTAFYKNRDTNNIAGYVVETDKKTIVAYHGTRFFRENGGQEVVNDLNYNKANMRFGDLNCTVHEGFKKEYQSSKSSLYAILNSRNNKNEVDFTGHSLGGAAAGLAALDAQTNHPEIKIGSVVNFGCPRFLSSEAANVYNATGLSNQTLRVKQSLDPVPRIPPKSMFQHVGNSIKLSATPYGVKLHGSGVYKGMVSKITDKDLDKKKASKNYNSFPVYKYIVSKLKKSEIVKAISKAVGIRGALMNSLPKVYYEGRVPGSKPQSKTQSSSVSR